MAYEIKITPEMKRQFRSETTEHLNGFEKMLMVIEKDPRNHEAIHSAFRYVHSLKGNSDYLGIKDINTLSHDLEDLMDDLRGGSVSIAGEVLAVLFEGLDLLRDMNRRVTDEVYEKSDISEIQTRIRHAKAFAAKDTSGEFHEISYSNLFSNVLEKEIKVGLDRIDEFMAHVSEFVITKNTLNYLTESIVSDHQVSEWSGKLTKISANMNRIANSLQADVMKLRLVRINTLFERLPRIVRDLSSRSRKKIDLSLSGGETEIERRTIEKLVDPLIHLIRNSVDHGIELPDDRIGKGKPASGTITVSACQEGNHAVIDLADDGRGLDTDEIRQEALKRRLFPQEVLTAMTHDEIINLVFMPGFSTKASATEVSGRGVGLDVVRSNIKAVGGSITLSGKPGVNTQVRLRVPISMSMTDVLLIKVAERQYAFPFASILKTVKVGKKNVHGPERGEFILFDGSALPIRHIREILGISKREWLRKKDSDEQLSVIAVNSENQVRGIVVDQILKRETILIRPLENFLSGIREFSGTALLGDGKVILVIDPMGIF